MPSRFPGFRDAPLQGIALPRVLPRKESKRPKIEARKPENVEENRSGTVIGKWRQEMKKKRLEYQQEMARLESLKELRKVGRRPMQTKPKTEDINLGLPSIMKLSQYDRSHYLENEYKAVQLQKEQNRLRQLEEARTDRLRKAMSLYHATESFITNEEQLERALENEFKEKDAAARIGGRIDPFDAHSFLGSEDSDALRRLADAVAGFSGYAGVGEREVQEIINRKNGQQEQAVNDSEDGSMRVSATDTVVTEEQNPPTKDS